MLVERPLDAWRHVRVLRDDAELAEALARAAESDRRLRDRLETRAAHEAWMVEQRQLGAGWLRFVGHPRIPGPGALRDRQSLPAPESPAA